MHSFDRFSFGARQLLTVFTVLASAIVIQAQAAVAPVILPATNAPQSAWAKFEKVFIFGDSWSNIGFNWTGSQPSPSNPLGNPNYTAADVAANGARWPVYLTITYNASKLQTYTLAQTGGVIDSGITPHGSDFVFQVKKDFLPTYGNSSSGNWSSGSSLFISFFGVNDVNLILPFKNASAYLDRIFGSYETSIEVLYKAGARNFLLINEPPMDLAPSALPGLKPLITDFNNRITLLIAALAKKYHSSTPSTSMNIIQFDINTLFTSILANPASNPITAGIKNTTGWCPAYYDMGRRHGADFFDPSCGGLKLGDYAWINMIHPTLVMYQAIAQGIAGMFGA